MHLSATSRDPRRCNGILIALLKKKSLSRCFFLSVGFSLAVFEAANSEVITGRVLAASDSVALSGASVYLPESGHGILTDEKGLFRLSAEPGRQLLVVSFVGCHTRTLPVDVREGEVVLEDIVLEQTALELPGVVVTATRRVQPFSEAPVSISVSEQREIARFNSFTLSGPLRVMPGVTKVGSQINIRGSSGYSRGTGSRVLLLLDGIPMVSADQGDIKWDIVPVDEVERVEIIKGSGSALYGTGALGGVINVLTREPSKIIQTRFRLITGVYDQPAFKSWQWRDRMLFNGVDVSHSRPVGSGGYLISAGHKRGTGYQENGEFNRYHLFGKSTFQLNDRTRWTTLYNWAYDDHGVFLQWRDRSNPLTVPDNDRLAATVSWKLNVNSELSHVRPGSSITWRNYYFRTDFANTRAAGSLASVGHKIGTEFQLDLSQRFGSRQFIVGTTGVYDLARSPADFLGERTVLNTALYTQNIVDLPGDGELAAGFRLDLHHRGQGKSASEGPCGPAQGVSAISHRTEVQANPQLGFSWSNDLGALRISAGRGFRAPAATEIHTQADVSGILVCPNPGLKSESSWSYELGVRGLVNDVVATDAALFWNDFYDLIEARPDPAFGTVPRASFRNISRARIRGLELVNQMVLPLGGHLQWSYTYIDAVEFLDNDDLLPPYCHDHLQSGHQAPLPYRSRHNMTSTVTAGKRDTRGGVSLRFMSRFERVSGLFAECRRDHLPVYLVDAFVSHDIGSISFNLRVDNLLRYHYVLTEREIRPIRSVTFGISGAF